MKTVLVVGGAGYIGSHMVLKLLEEKCWPIVLDNLSTGYRDAVSNAEFIQCDLGKLEDLEHVFQSYHFDAVMHFASYIQVGESVIAPEKYYRNNLSNTFNLLCMLNKYQVNNFIFSSSAAVYGLPEYIPIDENHHVNPINPYGRTKLMVEQMLVDYEKAYGLHSISLRYFNAAGAHPDGLLGERHDPETHLIPLVLQVASGRRSHITLYGDDYDTPDGTCIRDYIHVCDLCDAHWLALQYVWSKQKSDVFNLGNGEGYSVQEVINMAKQVTQKEITVKKGGRREGDPARLVADATRAKNVLKWCSNYPELKDMIKHAWVWERKIAGIQ